MISGDNGTKQTRRRWVLALSMLNSLMITVKKGNTRQLAKSGTGLSCTIHLAPIQFLLQLFKFLFQEKELSSAHQIFRKDILTILIQIKNSMSFFLKFKALFENWFIQKV